MDPAIATGVIWVVAFLFSTTVHEAMHALVAWKGGDPTAYHGGQVSLSPIPHIKREPIGMLVVPLITTFTMGWTMGWASAPYDPVWAERHPRRAALMAAAGRPATS
jgi:Zn-dependent protease